MSVDYKILDSIPASIYWKDLDGKYLGCNKYMLDMAGLESRDALLGKTDYDLPWQDQAKKIQEFDRLVIKTNRAYEREEHPESADKVIRSFRSVKSPLYDDNGLICGIIGVSLDITEQTIVRMALKDTQDLLEKSLSIKDRFVRNIDHEVRNPLQVFVTLAQNLAESWSSIPPAERYDAVQLIAASAERLSSLVLRTFDLSELVTNRYEMDLRIHDFGQIISDRIKDFSKSHCDNGSNITFSQKGQYMICCDKVKIEQVLDELLMNAIKWGAVGKDIVIKIEETSMPDNLVKAICCSVIDTGIAIPEKELSFIFEPFTESSNTASPACGIGLGLALCKKIIAEHKGRIWAQNNNEGGVTVSFVIPMAQID